MTKVTKQMGKERIKMKKEKEKRKKKNYYLEDL